MQKISEKQQNILLLLLEKGLLSSSAIHVESAKRGVELSLVTIKRTLSQMVKLGFLASEGAGPSTKYRVSVKGRLEADIDAHRYCAIEPDQRYGMRHYNGELVPGLPSDLFFDHELRTLDEATREYRRRTTDLPQAIQKKELERLVIELSWKSSRIEGNTYTLLDTERLILEHKEAPGHAPEEAQMILNHKDAFAFVHANRAVFKTLTRANLDHLHSLLVKNLGVGRGFRKRPMGVLGSIYQPLDNIHQINDAVDDLVHAVAKMKTPYAKALVALIGISYIQPFEDGNKRTSRLMANALLMAHGRAPLSYRSVDENEYREAMLVFYELNSLIPLKNIFIAQYDFAARNYAVK
ncbi:MAG: Fic family protein [Candidatus Kerfeldbacteria bacterium]|nr:Fic family protein [Candidatus Kerfeldbacteria bacterium]